MVFAAEAAEIIMSHLVRIVVSSALLCGSAAFAPRAVCFLHASGFSPRLPRCSTIVLGDLGQAQMAIHSTYTECTFGSAGS